MSNLSFFSSNHLVLILIVIFVSIVLTFFLYRNQSNKKIGIIFGYLVLVKIFIYTIIGSYMSNIFIYQNLPLYMCDITAIFCSLFLIKPKQFLFEYIVYFGWIAALNAILTPKLIHGNQTIFIMDYIFQHSFIFAVTFYIVYYQKNKINDKSLIRSTIITIVFIIIPVHFFNIYFKTNYFFTITPPFKNHPLILGDWPLYLFGFIFIGIIGAIIVNFFLKKTNYEIKI